MNQFTRIVKRQVRVQAQSQAWDQVQSQVQSQAWDQVQSQAVGQAWNQVRVQVWNHVNLGASDEHL